MTLSMYQASIPVFINMLSNLSAILDFAETEFAKNGPEEKTFMDARFYPDMFTFAQQIRQVSHHAVNFAAALTETEPPALPEDYESFTGLIARIAATVSYLESVKPGDIDGTEDKTVDYIVAGAPRAFDGQRLLLGHCMPNFMFHITTAYDLLRHNGLNVGKRHFLGYAKPGDQ